jgi:DNA-directed RNA polymerase subunit H (RpoH/RPB5)
MSQTDIVKEVFKSRQTIISLLEKQGYNVDNYKSFSISEVSSMYQTKQLDMLLNTTDNEKKTYVKYSLSKVMRPVNIYEIIDDLFNLEEVLKKKDNLIIIMKDEPNDTLIKLINHIWVQDGVFIIIFNIKRLQFNITEHSRVPPHKVLSETISTEVRKKYNITDDSQIPNISRFDPVAQAIGIRPGQLCHITRPSKTASTADFYRLCSS